MPTAAEPREENTARITLPVEGMTCAACQANVQRALTRTAGVKQASVNLMTHDASIVYDPALASPRRWSMRSTPRVTNRTFPRSALRPSSRRTKHASRRTRRSTESLLRRSLVSLALGLAAMGSMFWMGDAHVGGIADTIRYAWLAATIGVMTWAGGQIYVRAWNALRHGTANMNTLIAVGTLAAFSYSVVATVMPHRLAAAGAAADVYYEAVILIIALVLLGSALEARAKRQTTRALRELARLQPSTARVLRDVAERDIPIAEVRVGDRVVVRPGERFPVDGRCWMAQARSMSRC